MSKLEEDPCHQNGVLHGSLLCELPLSESKIDSTTCLLQSGQSLVAARQNNQSPVQIHDRHMPGRWLVQQQHQLYWHPADQQGQSSLQPSDVWTKRPPPQVELQQQQVAGDHSEFPRHPLHVESANQPPWHNRPLEAHIPAPADRSDWNSSNNDNPDLPTAGKRKRLSLPLSEPIQGQSQEKGLPDASVKDFDGASLEMMAAAGTTTRSSNAPACKRRRRNPNQISEEDSVDRQRPCSSIQFCAPSSTRFERVFPTTYHWIHRRKRRRRQRLGGLEGAVEASSRDGNDSSSSSTSSSSLMFENSLSLSGPDDRSDDDSSRSDSSSSSSSSSTTSDDTTSSSYVSDLTEPNYVVWPNPFDNDDDDEDGGGAAAANGAAASDMALRVISVISTAVIAVDGAWTALSSLFRSHQPTP